MAYGPHRGSLCPFWGIGVYSENPKSYEPYGMMLCEIPYLIGPITDNVGGRSPDGRWLKNRRDVVRSLFSCGGTRRVFRWVNA